MATDALYIHPSSPISTTSGTIYTNSPTASTELFIYDNSYSSHMVTFIRKEGTKYKLVYTGMVHGFPDIYYEYLYRFDFGRFIKYNGIDTTLTHDGPYLSYFSGNNDCDLTLCFGDIFTTSGYMIDTYPNGEKYLKPGYTPTDVIATKYRYTFIDREDSIGYYKPGALYRDSWYPITVYSGTVHFSLFDTSNTLLKTSSIGVDSGYNYKVAFIKIPSNVRSVQFAYGATGLPEIYPSEGCVKQVFFMGRNGSFDALHCTGVDNVREEVRKEYIAVGKNTIITKQETQKQIIQNTGLGISSSQMYGLLNSSLVYRVENGKFQEYKLENTEFGGYNGVQLSGRNLELTLTLPYTTSRVTSKQASFLD